jgi:hypothetical protein
VTYDAVEPLPMVDMYKVQKLALSAACATVLEHGRLGYLPTTEVRSSDRTRIFIEPPLALNSMLRTNCVSILEWHRARRLANSGTTMHAGRAWLCPTVQPIVVDGLLYLQLSRIMRDRLTSLSPDYYAQVVLVPGGWHLCWHVMRAIY